MSFKDLATVYMNFLSHLNDISILSLLSFSSIEDYPSNIPSNICEPFFEDLETIAKGILQIVEKKTNPDNSSEEKISFAYSIKSEMSSRFVISLLYKQRLKEMLIPNKFSKDKKKEIDFESVLMKIALEQEFLSLYSLLDNYINNILRIIFKKQPKMLSPNEIPSNEQKEIRWDEILKLNSYNDIIEFMIEKYIYSIGYKSLFERLKVFQDKKFRFRFQLKEKHKMFLDETQEIRNCLVHNGGRLTHKSLSKLDNYKLKIGDVIVLTTEKNNDIYRKFTDIASILFKETAAKFFNKEFRKAKKGTDYVNYHSPNNFFK